MNQSVYKYDCGFFLFFFLWSATGSWFVHGAALQERGARGRLRPLNGVIDMMLLSSVFRPTREDVLFASQLHKTQE